MGSKRANILNNSRVTKPVDAVESYSLRHFDVSDFERVREKLAEFKHDLPKRFVFIADFDNTLTQRGYSIWEALTHALPEVGRQDSNAERSINLAKEAAGKLRGEEVIAWSERELSRYATYGVTLASIDKAVRHIKLRRGARKLFRICAAAGVESHIISTGVTEAIEALVRRKKLQLTKVHSNRLLTEEGVVVEWDRAGMLHVLNKHEYGAQAMTTGGRKLTELRQIVLGDNRHDADMAPDESALRIRVRGKNGNTKDYLKESFSKSRISSGFDLVLKTESLLPVVDLMEWLIKPV
jgi:phosphoserine phosphatase